MRRKGIFDEFFREFEEMDETFERLFEGLRTGELRDIEGPLYYGFSMHVGPEGIPKITHFGNVRPEIAGHIYSDSREAFCDVIVDDKAKEVIVTLEMPGVEKKDINLETTENSVEVKTETETRKYHKKIPLEQEIKPDTAKASYNNGVLEIKAKLKSPAKKGKKIKVE
ncbi:MAG: archaeal heat shock protein Hsp20 [Candidatus Hydrothermarchaeales archaeon]